MVTFEAMKKIRCPQCAVINLERFVTFPHCAGCGTLLSNQEAHAQVEKTPTMRQPLRPALWATLFAGVVVAIGLLLTKALNVSASPPGQLVIYGRMTRVTGVGKTISADLTVDATGNDIARRDAELTGVKLRISDRFFRDFQFVGLEPKPDRQMSSGTGRYYYYSHLPLNTRLRLQVQSLRPGQFLFESSVYADEQYAGDFNAVINVRH
jgi:hypothetical protein